MPRSKLQLILNISWLLLGCTLEQTAYGISLDTLPRGVRSPQVRFGNLNNLGQVYGTDSKLWRLEDQSSVNLDAANIAKINPDAKILIHALDTFGSQNLGKDINLGTLLVNARPEVSYQAAIFGYGVTDRWTLAFALPIIHYTNHTTLDSTPGNLSFYRSQFLGYSKALDNALNIDIVSEGHKYIMAQGFRGLDERDQKFAGDANLVSLYQWSLFELRAIHSLTLTLPTGPSEDPDDLLALNRFHRTEIKNLVAFGFPVTSKFLWKPFASVNLPLPEKIVKRVPKNESDKLPADDQKENLERLRGPTLALGNELEFALTTRWTLVGSYQVTSSAKDSYKGERNSRYDLLENDTNSNSHQVTASISYSTIQSYLATKSFIPLTINLAWSDIIVGRNLNREQTNELTLVAYF